MIYLGKDPLKHVVELSKRPLGIVVLALLIFGGGAFALGYWHFNPSPVSRASDCNVSINGLDSHDNGGDGVNNRGGKLCGNDWHMHGNEGSGLHNEN